MQCECRMWVNLIQRGTIYACSMRTLGRTPCDTYYNRINFLSDQMTTWQMGGVGLHNFLQHTISSTPPPFFISSVRLKFRVLVPAILHAAFVSFWFAWENVRASNCTVRPLERYVTLSSRTMRPHARNDIADRKIVEIVSHSRRRDFRESMKRKHRKHVNARPMPKHLYECDCRTKTTK